WYKLSRHLLARPGRPEGLPSDLIALKRQRRQSVEGTPHVEQLRVRVNAHRQLDVAVTHRGLRRPRGNPPLAEQRPEGSPQGVDIEGRAALVALGDAGKLQVAVKDALQAARYGEEGRIGRQPGGDRTAGLAGFLLELVQLVGEPVAQVGGE